MPPLLPTNDERYRRPQSRCFARLRVRALFPRFCARKYSRAIDPLFYFVVVVADIAEKKKADRNIAFAAFSRLTNFRMCRIFLLSVLLLLLLARVNGGHVRSRYFSVCLSRMR